MNKPAKILFKVTSRSRPLWLFRGLDSIYQNLLDKENFCVICTFDSDDNTMNNDGVIEKLNTYKNLEYFFGESKTKIEAINNDIDKFPDDYDILINFSDDQVFSSLYFDRIIREAFIQYSPDFSGTIHFPDTKTNAALITMSILGRQLFQKLGWIYHPDFISVYCDNHFQDICKKLNKYTFINIPIYVHLHPAFGLATWDAQYRKTEDRNIYAKDRETYLRHKANNFYLDL